MLTAGSGGGLQERVRVVQDRVRSQDRVAHRQARIATDADLANAALPARQPGHVPAVNQSLAFRSESHAAMGEGPHKNS